MIPRTRSTLLCFIEQRLVSMGFEGELWTDGERFTVDGEAVKMRFTFDQFEERKAELQVFYGMDPMTEMIIILTTEIALAIDLVEPFACEGCGASWFYRKVGTTESCPACLAKDGLEAKAVANILHPPGPTIVRVIEKGPVNRAGDPIIGPEQFAGEFGDGTNE